MIAFEMPTTFLPGSGDVLDDEARDVADERRLAAALAGRVSDRDGRNADRYRGVIERRVASCLRVAGCTLAKLKENEPERYRRFLRGCSRALKREAAIADGTLSGAELAYLKRRYSAQRDIDRYAADFPDFEEPDDSERRHP